jgi:hypothetical protein
LNNCTYYLVGKQKIWKENSTGIQTQPISMTTSSIFRTISTIDAHRGEGERRVRLYKFGHKNAIKDENRGPPRLKSKTKIGDPLDFLPTSSTP